MAKLNVVRIDSRLIHGQVVTQWVRKTNTKRIIIVDDALIHDKFMSKILKMAAPPSTKVEIVSTEKAGAQWQEDQFGAGSVMVLFKDVPTAHAAYQQGFTYPRLQLGGIGAGPGRVLAFGPISLSEEDAHMLDELAEKGCEVVFQVLVEDSPAGWDSVRKKAFPNL